MNNLAKEYSTEIKKTLKSEFGYKNDFQIPKISKVTINMGAGQAKDSEEILKNVTQAMEQISGQKPKINQSRKSISGFKLRAGQIVGLSTTLRGERMFDFIERLVKVSLPRIRDFRGLSDKSFDRAGNFSLGIREHIIFPEIKFDNVRGPISLQVNITTSAKNQAEGKRLLELFGFPFIKKVSAEITHGEQNG